LKSKRILQNEEAPGSRTSASERRIYVVKRSVNVRISVTKVTITIGVGDETVVIEIPIY
jgi:hypothetical protein